MSDLIERQAAIDVAESAKCTNDITLTGDSFSKGFRDGYKAKENSVIEALKALPPAVVAENATSDTISRQAAYDTLTDYYHHTTDTQHKALREAINRVPPFEPYKESKNE